MMNKVKITEENYKQVFGRLEKFFNHDNLETWHQFDCGMKKRIGHIIHIDGEPCDVRYNVYDNECAIEGDTLIFYYNDFSTPMDHHYQACALIVSIGDEVAFLGNRIIVKTRSPVTYYHYVYQCFQIM